MILRLCPCSAALHLAFRSAQCLTVASLFSFCCQWLLSGLTPSRIPLGKISPRLLSEQMFLCQVLAGVKGEADDLSLAYTFDMD